MQRRDTSQHWNRNYDSVIVWGALQKMNPGVPVAAEELEVADAAQEILVD